MIGIGIAFAFFKKAAPEARRGGQIGGNPELQFGAFVVTGELTSQLLSSSTGLGKHDRDNEGKQENAAAGRKCREILPCSRTEGSPAEAAEGLSKALAPACSSGLAGEKKPWPTSTTRLTPPSAPSPVTPTAPPPKTPPGGRAQEGRQRDATYT